MRLTEITDKNILAQIDNLIPRSLQTAANAIAVNDYQENVKSIGGYIKLLFPKELFWQIQKQCKEL